MSGSHHRSSSTWHCVSPLLGDSRAGVPYRLPRSVHIAFPRDGVFVGTHRTLDRAGALHIPNLDELPESGWAAGHPESALGAGRPD